MPCYKPLKAFRSVEKGPNGLPLITFNPLKAINSHLPMSLPCGRCIGCRLTKVDNWASRCMHEAQMHEHNSFITLTFDNEHLPEDYSVHVRTWQLFMKRLRKEIEPTQIRFFACGEYGEQTLRPHYHALIFGYAFPDREFHSTTTGGIRQFTSVLLSRVWPFGQSLLGSVTYGSASYVAGYAMKKIGGDPAASHYLRTHPLTGATVTVQPEFAVQSRRPGIGSTWFDKYKDDCFPSDFIIVEGRQKAVPRYYTLKLQEEERLEIQRKRKRQSVQPAQKANRSKERLAVREYIKQDKVNRGQGRNLKDNN